MKIWIIFIVLLAGTSLSAQAVTLSRLFAEISLRIDTASYRWSQHRLGRFGEEKLWFDYREENPVVELRFYPIYGLPRPPVRLLPADDYSIVDSLRWENDRYYYARLELKELTTRDFPRILLQYHPPLGDSVLLPLPLQPVTHTRIFWRQPPEEIFVGEEYTFDLECNNPANVITHRTWITEGDIHYRLTRRQGRLQLQLQAQRLGETILTVPLALRRPWRDSSGQLVYQLPPLTADLNVKPARLKFLGVNPREIILQTDTRRQTEEIELEYDPRLQPDKTYRIEAQEAPGGFLIAELFTRQRLANGRMLCWLRPYDYHRRQEGYLYIKNGDQAIYLTNLDILPATQIEEIAILRAGEDWKPGRDVHPGERIGIRLKGQALNRAQFQFPSLTEVVRDSAQSNEQEVYYEVSVPLDIRERNPEILDAGQGTGQRLRVREYSRPHPLDFVDVRINDVQYTLAGLDKLIFLPTSVDDIVLGLRPDMIDRGGLYGPQKLTVTVEVRDQRNQLVDQREMPVFTVCPQPSPRAAFYREQRCRIDNISLNGILRKRIFDLEPWSTIRVTVAHDRGTYGQEGYSRTAEFILYQRSSFDVDVSFPAGLITKRVGEAGFGSLGGISMAMIAQFSFYQSNKIASAKPYKFGAGFLALNAFDFGSTNNSRDVGLVALASLYPIKTKYSSRLSFPLYMGGGYLLSERKWFVLLGPGIRVRL